MSDDEHDEPAKRSKWRAWAVAVPVLYVLSYAPALSLMSALDRRSVSAVPQLWTAWWTIYAPVHWVAHRSEWFSDLLGWYVDLMP